MTYGIDPTIGAEVDNYLNGGGYSTGGIDFFSGGGGGGSNLLYQLLMGSGGGNPMSNVLQDYYSGLQDYTTRAPSWSEQLFNFGQLPDQIYSAGGYNFSQAPSKADLAAIALGRTPQGTITSGSDWGRNIGYGLAGLTGGLGVLSALDQYRRRKDDRNLRNRLADNSIRAQDYALSRTQQQDSRADQMTTAYNDQAISNSKWRPTTKPDGTRGYVNVETGQFVNARPTTAKPVLLARGGLAHLGESSGRSQLFKAGSRLFEVGSDGQIREISGHPRELLPGAVSNRDDLELMRMLPGIMSDRDSEMMGDALPYGFETLRGLTEEPELLTPEELNSIPRKRGGRVAGPGMGQEDAIPAQLSDGEYIIDASTVSDLGDGSTEAGAKALDQMVKTVRKEKRGGLSHLPPKAKAPTQYLKRRV